MTDLAYSLVNVLASTRFPAGPEKELQEAIGVALTNAGIAFEREVRLNDTDIIDFLVSGVGIEVKIKGARRGIYRQLQRYAHSEAVHSLVLLSSVAMGLPPTIEGKPVTIVSLGRAWL